MNKKQIDCLRKYVKRNTEMSNKSLATLVKNTSTIFYDNTVGTIANYIGQVKRLDPSIINTGKDSCVEDIVKDERNGYSHDNKVEETDKFMSRIGEKPAVLPGANRINLLFLDKDKGLNNDVLSELLDSVSEFVRDATRSYEQEYFILFANDIIKIYTIQELAENCLELPSVIIGMLLAEPGHRNNVLALSEAIKIIKETPYSDLNKIVLTTSGCSTGSTQEQMNKVLLSFIKLSEEYEIKFSQFIYKPNTVDEVKEFRLDELSLISETYILK